jgi:hypothetical protein
MIRLEQVRGEMLERFERVDRRFAHNEQRVSRVDQRLADLTALIEALRQELLRQPGLPAPPVVAGAVPPAFVAGVVAPAFPDEDECEGHGNALAGAHESAS